MFDENTQNNTQSFAQNDPVANVQTENMPTVFPDTTTSNDPVSPVTTPDPSIVSDDQKPADSTDNSTQDENLISIKKNALQQLAPLIDQLDQEPEEKFKTMLMMIQASDDKTMLDSAYQTAQKISDEKLKAQALLDIVNEINYFTHPTKNE